MRRVLNATDTLFVGTQTYITQSVGIDRRESVGSPGYDPSCCVVAKRQRVWPGGNAPQGTIARSKALFAEARRAWAVVLVRA